MTAQSSGVFRATVREWGDAIGLRISYEEAARLGIEPGQELVLRVLGEGDRIDISHLSTFRDGRGADEHDAFLAEARLADLERQRR